MKDEIAALRLTPSLAMTTYPSLSSRACRKQARRSQATVFRLSAVCVSLQRRRGEKGRDCRGRARGAQSLAMTTYPVIASHAPCHREARFACRGDLKRPFSVYRAVCVSLQRRRGEKGRDCRGRTRSAHFLAMTIKRNCGVASFLVTTTR